MPNPRFALTVALTLCISLASAGEAATVTTSVVNLSASTGETLKYEPNGESYLIVTDTPAVNDQQVVHGESLASATASAPGANATGLATAGAAGVGASASVTASGKNYTITYDWYNPWQGVTETLSESLFQSASAAAQAHATFRDPITVAGPAGETGVFQLTLDFTRTGFTDSEFGGWSALGRGFVNTANGSVVLLVLELSENSSGGGTNQPQAVGTFNATAGTTLLLSQHVAVQASFNAQPSRESGSAFVNAGNTVKAYLTPLTPGFSITSESGYSYAVPEPSSSLLLLSFAVGLIRRRSQKADA